MKHISVLALSAMTTIGAIPLGAYAAPISHLHASGVITNNIATMQHAIMLNTFDNFGTSINLGEYAPITTEQQNVPPEKYSPVYGEMRPYGEYNDDGKANEAGRSGGDLATSNYNWFDWKHAQDNAKYKDFDKIKSRYDLISMGFSNEPQKIRGGYSQFGAFGGLIIAQEKDEAVKISENGGFVGLFKGYHINGLNLNAAADLGALFSDAKAVLGDYDYTNLWFGIGLNASYDIVISDTLTLQPGVYGGYTWIYSKGYEDLTGNNISIDNSHTMEVDPGVRAITHLGGNWYGTLAGRYVFNFANGGDTTIANVAIPELELKDYVEYGLSIERNADRFGFSVSLNRHDGGRTGWIGGLQVRYIF